MFQMFQHCKRSPICVICPFPFFLSRRSMPFTARVQHACARVVQHLRAHVNTLSHLMPPPA